MRRHKKTLFRDDKPKEGADRKKINSFSFPVSQDQFKGVTSFYLETRSKSSPISIPLQENYPGSF